MNYQLQDKLYRISRDTSLFASCIVTLTIEKLFLYPLSPILLLFFCMLNRSPRKDSSYLFFTCGLLEDLSNISHSFGIYTILFLGIELLIYQASKVISFNYMPATLVIMIISSFFILFIPFILEHKVVGLFPLKQSIGLLLIALLLILPYITVKSFMDINT
ncbi:MAG: hypothetical protein HY606_03390 [Planctomycetes bacterium]|nr:hypothetical protein [Planctomycetota bacterium]